MDKEKNHKEAMPAKEGGAAQHPVGHGVDLHTSRHTDTPGERTGEGDRTDTEEMHNLDNGDEEDS